VISANYRVKEWFLIAGHVHSQDTKPQFPSYFSDQRELQRRGQGQKPYPCHITCLPKETIEVLRRSLKGEALVAPGDAFEIIEDGSPAHGHVEAVLTAMKRLNFPQLISAKRSRNRDLIVALVAARLIRPQSKLATTLWWHDTTLPELLDVSDADEDDIYGAMDWLLEQQGCIEKRLSNRHLGEGSMVLYDLTSSYFEGETCPLAARGYSRDGKRGKLQVNYGLLTDREGVPVCVSVFKGDTSDPGTVLSQVERLREDFGIERFVLVGDRGMLTQKHLESIRDIGGIDWISALRSGAIKKLVKAGSFQLGLFDEYNLFEFMHPDFPGERLIACRNPVLAVRRASIRNELLDATCKELDRIQEMIGRGRLRGHRQIQEKIDKVLREYKIGRYFRVVVHDDGFEYGYDEQQLLEEVTGGIEDKELIEKKRARLFRHIASIIKKLDKIQEQTRHGRLHGKDKIGLKIGRVLNKYKMAKHFIVDIEDDGFRYRIDTSSVHEESVLDGIYVIRTSVSKDKIDSAGAVRAYKRLSEVEQAFRSFKSIDLMVRPIRHRLSDRVRAHIFLCMLTYYVQHHMMEAWRPLLFADEEQFRKESRDPVRPASRSASALDKIHKKHLKDGTVAYSFRGLLDHLGSIVKATCRCPDGSTFTMTTRPNPKQEKALKLLESIKL